MSKTRVKTYFVSSEKCTNGTDIVLVIDSDNYSSAFGRRGDERLFGAKGPREEFIDSEGNLIERKNKIPRYEVNWDAVKPGQAPQKLVDTIENIRQAGIKRGIIYPKESDKAESVEVNVNSSSSSSSENKQSKGTKPLDYDSESDSKMEE
jgi:hypothetical protein